MSLPDKPIGRLETYLAKIAGEAVTLPTAPISREEQYLAKIAGEAVDIPTGPVGRIETYLAKIAGEAVTLPESPISREEHYLAAIAGEDVALPNAPISRIEMYLDEIANSGDPVIVTKPTVSGNSFTYNGTAQGPTITWAEGMEQYCNVSHATETNAGTYTLTIALKNLRTMTWSDDTKDPITYEYTIAKANAVLTVSPSSVSLTPSTTTATVSVAWTGDGVAAISSSDTTVVTVSPATLSAAGNFTVTAGSTSGSATITVSVAATTNYNAASDTVSASYQTITLKTFAEATEAELVEMVQAADDGLIDLYEDAGWRVGQEREVSISAISSSGTYDGVSWSVGESQSAQTITLVLMHKGDYELVTPVKAKGGADRSTCSFVVGMKDCLDETGYLNSSQTDVKNGWQAVSRRNWCNGGFRGALPNGIEGIFKKFKCYFWNKTLSQINITQDYFTLPAEKEIFGVTAQGYDGEANVLVWFDWYKTEAHRKKLVNASAGQWWSRSVSIVGSSYCTVQNGTVSAAAVNAYPPKGISPFGCV